MWWNLGESSIRKIFSLTFFLYFSLLLPTAISSLSNLSHAVKALHSQILHLHFMGSCPISYLHMCLLLMMLPLIESNHRVNTVTHVWALLSEMQFDEKYGQRASGCALGPSFFHAWPELGVFSDESGVLTLYSSIGVTGQRRTPL